MLGREIVTHNNVSFSRGAQKRRKKLPRPKAIVIAPDSIGEIFDGQQQTSVLEQCFEEVVRRERATKRAGRDTKRI